MNIFKQNRSAIYFLFVFVGTYLVLNTIYGLYVEFYSPDPDPITISVSNQLATLLRFWDQSVRAVLVTGSKNVSMRNSHSSVINVFEGCNGINVFIVFISFLFAFRGRVRSTSFFIVVGLLIIHLMNLTRVGLLYAVEIH